MTKRTFREKLYVQRAQHGKDNSYEPGKWRRESWHNPEVVRGQPIPKEKLRHVWLSDGTGGGTTLEAFGGELIEYSAPAFVDWIVYFYLDDKLEQFQSRMSGLGLDEASTKFQNLDDNVGLYTRGKGSGKLRFLV